MIGEVYIVRFDFKESNGFWKMNLEETVQVLTPANKHKNNHDAATRIIKKKYPGCKVVSTTYV